MFNSIMEPCEGALDLSMKSCSRHLTPAARLESIIRETILGPSDTYQRPDFPKPRIRVRGEIEPSLGNGRFCVPESIQEPRIPPTNLHLLGVGKEWVPQRAVCWLLGPVCHPPIGSCCLYQPRPQSLPPLVPIPSTCRAYSAQESEAYPHSSTHTEAMPQSSQTIVDYPQLRMPSQAILRPNEASTNKVVLCPEHMSSHNQLKVNIMKSQGANSKNKVLGITLFRNCSMCR